MDARDCHIFGESHFFDGGAGRAQCPSCPGHHVASRAPQHVRERRGVPRKVQQLSAHGANEDGRRIARVDLSRPAARRDLRYRADRLALAFDVNGKTFAVARDLRDARTLRQTTPCASAARTSARTRPGAETSA